MTETESAPHSPSDSSGSDGRALLRFEARLSQAEAQIRALQEGVSDLNLYARRAKQRALYLRIGLLVAIVAAFFLLQYSK